MCVCVCVCVFVCVCVCILRVSEWCDSDFRRYVSFAESSPAIDGSPSYGCIRDTISHFEVPFCGLCAIDLQRSAATAMDYIRSLVV